MARPVVMHSPPKPKPQPLGTRDVGVPEQYIYRTPAAAKGARGQEIHPVMRAALESAQQAKTNARPPTKESRDGRGLDTWESPGPQELLEWIGSRSEPQLRGGGLGAGPRSPLGEAGHALLRPRPCMKPSCEPLPGIMECMEKLEAFRSAAASSAAIVAGSMREPSMRARAARLAASIARAGPHVARRSGGGAPRPKRPPASAVLGAPQEQAPEEPLPGIAECRAKLGALRDAALAAEAASRLVAAFLGYLARSEAATPTAASLTDGSTFFLAARGPREGNPGDGGK
eukprot:CAMPEP_0170240510 /NCGR_PEP_ID=MMETSP0116_2-20130129/20014_1 /TAXON_ID=400756 /ORGANISM="Durinskia baltica, Strain CSIRO CS-38" /LENGTH=286 /DNA_ID=CAMNT_0010491331 /DNA_START=145 /DNA_END=1003 /DNA_ORIENTATION=+